MDKLWAPWRIKYIQAHKTRGCIFCQKTREKKDRKNLIVARKKLVFAMLNIFPYNNGHVLISPYRHVADLEKLTVAEQTEMMALINEMTRTLKSALRPQGFNIGANVGKVAGAGIAAHVHMHIVPRWDADTNFMPVLTNTKVISQSLEELYNLLTS